MRGDGSGRNGSEGKNGMRVAVCVLLTAGLAAGASPVAAQEWAVFEVPNSAIVFDAAIEDNIVWLSTRSDGLIGYDGTTWVLHRAADCDSCIRTDKWNYSILVDSAGEKWMGRDDKDNTVDRLDDAGTFSDKTDDSWSYYTYQVELENFRVFSMAEDLNGNKWFGMRDENHENLGTVDLFIENSDTTAADDEWYHYDNLWTPDSTRFSDDDVRALTVDHGGRLWIGYGASGVDVWDYGNPATFADDSWEHYDKYNGLPNNSVSELHVGNDGRVWIGTGGGLSVHDPSFGGFETVAGLPGEEIRAIDSDARDHIWVGTDAGVAMLYRSGAVAFTYDEEDGIRDLDISEIVVDRAGAIVWAVSRNEMTLEATLNRLVTPYGSDAEAFFVYPNPLRSDSPFASVAIVGVPDGSTIEIFDVSGQKVRELGPRKEPYVWDTLDSSSLEVPSGVYLIRMESPEGRVAVTKTAVIR